MNGRLLTLCLPLALMACQPAQTPPRQPLPDADSPGARLMTERCGQCHAPPAPTRHSAEEWPSVVERMRVHMVRQANQVLNDEETRIVLDYLMKHARTGS